MNQKTHHSATPALSQHCWQGAADPAWHHSVPRCPWKARNQGWCFWWCEVQSTDLKWLGSFCYFLKIDDWFPDWYGIYFKVIQCWWNCLWIKCTMLLCSSIKLLTTNQKAKGFCSTVSSTFWVEISYQPLSKFIFTQLANRPFQLIDLNCRWHWWLSSQIVVELLRAQAPEYDWKGHAQSMDWHTVSCQPVELLIPSTCRIIKPWENCITKNVQSPKECAGENLDQCKYPPSTCW